MKLDVWYYGIEPGEMGHGLVVEFATEAVALDYVRRKSDRCAFQEVESEPLPDTATELLALLYPTCHHGMSLSLCADPINHYPSDAQMMRGF